MMDSISLQCFIAVAETKSFTQAASRVGRTQSAVSQQISKLENFAGNKLFIRGKELNMTTEGEQFLLYARKIYQLQREAIDRYKNPELEGEIRFGLPEDFAWMMLSDVLGEFSQLHPRIVLKVETHLTKKLISEFNHNHLDMILYKSDHPHDTRETTTIWQQPIEWVGTSMSQSMLENAAQIPLVLSPAPCVYREKILESLEIAGLKWRMTFTSSSYASKMAAVQAGMGITAIQKSLIPKNLEALKMPLLPALGSVYATLLTPEKKSKPIESLAYFLMKKMG